MKIKLLIFAWNFKTKKLRLVFLLWSFALFGHFYLICLFICCRCFVRSTIGAWNALFVTLTTTTMGKFVSKNIPARDTTFRFEYTMSKKWFTDLKSRYYHSSRIRSAPLQLRDEQKIQILKLKIKCRLTPRTSRKNDQICFTFYLRVEKRKSKC